MVTQMNVMFSDRMSDVPRSFIREILKVSTDPEIISFAGGLPNREYFPVRQLQHAATRVFEEQGAECLQYSNSEGLLSLREFIAHRYKINEQIDVNPAHILITNGSQQALDLIAKVVLNEGDPVILEEPGYLGAIQALSLYRPNYLPIEVSDHGMDVEKLTLLIEKNTPKLMYTVPNFQNPSGITYSGENRNNIAERVAGKSLLLVEDDPYGALRFAGTKEQSFYHRIPEQTLLLGSFSKVVVPGFRIGWVVAPEHMYENLLIAKQASDLHTCNFTQFILHRYLIDNDFDEHIKNICRVYGRQRQAMLDSIDEFFPSEISSTRPEGGMFLWGRLPDEVKSMSLFGQAVAKRVVFVPGDPFYTTARRTSTFRLNFSCVDEHHIREGIKRLSQALMGLLQMQ